MILFREEIWLSAPCCRKLMPPSEFKVANADFVDFEISEDLSFVVSVVVSCSFKLRAAVAFIVVASFSDPGDVGGEWLLEVLSGIVCDGVIVVDP